jgi:hypothetical protein
MTAQAAWPTRQDQVTAPDGGSTTAPDGEGAAHAAIGEMADLLLHSRGSTVTDGCLLGAIAAGLGLEAGLSPRVLPPGPAGVIGLGPLAAVVVCWLVSVVLLAWANRPVLNSVNQLRWVTGAPLDPRPRWIPLPPAAAGQAAWTWNRAHLLLGAARLTRHRTRFADTWTCFTGGCFILWTLFVVLSR